MIIFGAFEFLGFHLSGKFLEKGFEVNGVHVSTNDSTLLEEKRMEIGRNANFREQTFAEWKDQDGGGQEPAAIVIPFYDWYMDFNEGILEQEAINQPILQYMQAGRNKGSKVIFLLPMQFLEESGGSAEYQNIKAFIEKAKQTADICQSFYLPTLYGPWQPPSFLFQRTMLKRLNENDGPTGSMLREWDLDAIFIEDALDSLTEKMEENKGGEFLLESGVQDSWTKCAAVLKIDQYRRSRGSKHKLPDPGQMERLVLPKCTPADKALAVQWQHLFRINGGQID